MRRLVSIAVVIVSFFGLFGVSWRLAQPLFSHPFPAFRVDVPVLLVWPDHVETRMVQNLSEVMPVPKDAGYTFSIPPERQAWIEAAVRATPTPRPEKSVWVIHVTQLGAGRQKVDLELVGDGIYGMIYEARSNEIVPLKFRFTGPFGGFYVLAVDVLLSGLIWCGYWLFLRWMRRDRSAARS